MIRAPPVIPAKAGILGQRAAVGIWIPAFAGMTVRGAELSFTQLLRPLKGSVLGVSVSGGIARMLSHAASTPGYRLSSLRDGFDLGQHGVFMPREPQLDRGRVRR